MRHNMRNIGGRTDGRADGVGVSLIEKGFERRGGERGSYRRRFIIPLFPPNLIREKIYRNKRGRGGKEMYARMSPEKGRGTQFGR